MIDPIRLRVVPGEGAISGGQPVVAGIPFARGEVADAANLLLVDADGRVVAAYFSPVAHWPGGSLRWVHLFFQLSPSIDEAQYLDIVAVDSVTNPDPQAALAGIRCVKSPTGVAVDTGAGVFHADASPAGLLRQVTIDGAAQLDACGCRLVFCDAHGRELDARLTRFEPEDSENPLRQALGISGEFVDARGNAVVEYTSVVTFYRDLATVRLDVTLRNPAPARHPGGTWDLGDPGSILFGGLSVRIDPNAAGDRVAAEVRLDRRRRWQVISGEVYAVYQESSGGKNWRSRNHVNFRDQVPLSIDGFRCYRDGSEVDGGSRADPVIRWRSGTAGLSAYVAGFWQNFPKAIEIGPRDIELQLFPDRFPDLFELQGGEQKTHTFYLDFTGEPGALDWCAVPARVVLDADYLASTRTIPLFGGRSENGELQRLIDGGIEGEGNFFAKRETIDEYGWRNFGDTYADHEELEYRGTEPLVSHYNNQYDLVDGMLRQFLGGGDGRWLDLAVALARHVADIDIYHTRRDRDEYCGGLFWHTDHYANAFTATHRTYSSKNRDNGTAVGGGPGPEHCYTSGLANLYFVSGESAFRDTALKLAAWMERSFVGSGTIVERISKFASRDWPRFRGLLRGQRVLRYRYPFTRATGNYIATLLDAYRLTGEADFLAKTETVIRNTIHPADDISLRDLGNAEKNWSYLVLLQAICKYLAVKSADGAPDYAYRYARDSLAAYAAWMADNERPFLERRESLEFPNLTWAAQDLRKVYVLRMAASLEPAQRSVLLAAARRLEEYVVAKLRDSEQRRYTRTLAILMQNLPPRAEAIDASAREIDGPAPAWSPADTLYPSASSVIAEFAGDIRSRLGRLSPAAEFRWLKFRLRRR